MAAAAMPLAGQQWPTFIVTDMRPGAQNSWDDARNTMLGALYQITDAGFLLAHNSTYHVQALAFMLNRLPTRRVVIGIDPHLRAIAFIGLGDGQTRNYIYVRQNLPQAQIDQHFEGW